MDGKSITAGPLIPVRREYRPRPDLFRAACWVAAVFTIALLGFIIGQILFKAWPAISKFGFGFLTGIQWSPNRDLFGVLPVLIGTVASSAIAILIALPLGLAIALFLSENFLPMPIRQSVRFVAKLLTGVPSIICGVFAFAVVVMTTRQFSALAGGIALSTLILPTILLTAEQALLGVPNAYREASFGLGATPLQTIFRIVVPDAMPAIMTGVMLAVARAAGETAPVLFTALFSQNWIHSIMEPTASLSALIYNFSTLPYAYQVKMAWSASLILVALVTISNVCAQLFFSPKHR